MTPKRPLATCLIALQRLSPLGTGTIARGILAAFAAVAAAADAVHRDRQRLVHLLAERPEAHRPGHEPAHDRLFGLDLLQRHRPAPPDGS